VYSEAGKGQVDAARSIVPIEGLMNIFIAPRDFAQHVVDAVYEVEARRNIEVPFAIQYHPHATMVDILWQLFKAPPHSFVGTVDGSEPSLEGAPTSCSFALLERNDTVNLHAALAEVAVVECLLS
jgi:hypothetical protein